ncbi:MAG TPA: hypothetical protein VFF49_11235 [Thermodesulfobacteriota bacterium]|nr:hypothetical protein [Thermodesulfobacteriota bacterium]
MNNDTKETSWTSIDLYYKGFHIKKSVPSSYKATQIVKIINTYIKRGFEPSWNKDTSEIQLNKDPIMNATSGQGKKYVCATCGADADYKEGISKTGKPWRGIFCKETKEHVAWNATK